MEVQTQVEAFNPADNQMAADAKVSNFKSMLAALRSKVIAVLQEKKTVIDDLKELLSARADSIQLFVDEAVQIYPELQGTDVLATVARVANEHPLKLLWGKYRSTIVNFDRKLAARIEDYKVLIEGEQAIHTEEQSVLTSYSEFAAISPAPVPSVEELEAELAVEEVIPYAEESSLIASVSALDLLDSEAQGLITNEMATLASETAEIPPPPVKSNKGLLIAAGVVGLIFLFGGKK